MRSLGFHLAVVVILFGSIAGLAQTQPNLENGFKPYGSYHDDGIGAVNLMNGNVTTHLPFPQDYPQRGGRLDNHGFLVMNSKSWNIAESPAGYWYWNPITPWSPGSVSAQNSLFPVLVIRTYEKDVDPYGNVSTSAYNYGVTTWDGAQWGGSDNNPAITADTGWQIRRCTTE